MLVLQELIRFRHVGVVVQDLERALRFYRDLLGLTVVAQMRESGAYLDGLLGLRSADVTTAKLSAGAGATLIELVQFHSHHDTPAAAGAARPIYAVGPSHVAFTVQDLDAVYHRLAGAGVPFHSPPQRSADGAVRVCCCRDPDGTMVELVEPLGTR